MNWASEILTPLGYLLSSGSARTVSPAVVVVAAISLNNGLEASQWLAAPVDGNEGKEAVFDLIPFAGARGRWQTVIGKLSVLASVCNSTFHRRTRCPLLPPPSAVTSRRVALG